MSLSTDYQLVKAEEGSDTAGAIVMNSFDHCSSEVLAAFFKGDDLEAGRILRRYLEQDFRDEANAIQDSDPDWRIEAREIDNRDRVREMR